MNNIRIEADEAHAKVEELQTKIKHLEQSNLAKEHEITSLQHRNQLLEAEVEKLEAGIKEAKAVAEESRQHGTQNEALQRRLQLLEEEAEEADKNLKETNDKCVTRLSSFILSIFWAHILFGNVDLEYLADMFQSSDYVKLTSKLDITSERLWPWRLSGTSGKQNLKKCIRRTLRLSRSCKSCKIL